MGSQLAGAVRSKRNGMERAAYGTGQQRNVSSFSQSVAIGLSFYRFPKTLPLGFGFISSQGVAIGLGYIRFSAC